MPALGLAIPTLALRRLGSPALPPGSSTTVDRDTTTVDSNRRTTDRS
jgi:hypothetical protein